MPFLLIATLLLELIAVLVHLQVVKASLLDGIPESVLSWFGIHLMVDTHTITVAGPEFFLRRGTDHRLRTVRGRFRDLGIRPVPMER
jgi:hypothetical protein